MQLHLNETTHMLEIWLTGEENKDASLKASLEPVVKKYKEEKYLPVFFISGKEDLKNNTAELLRAQIKAANNQLSG